MDQPGTTEPVRGVRPPFWRRRWIVDAPFQWSLITRSLVQTLLTLLFVSIGIFGPIVQRMAAKDGANADDPAIVMLYMHGRFWWIAGACLLLAAFSALLVSHRIAGPLVRFKRNLRWLGEGRLPVPLRTRDGDHMQPEVECLNAAVEGLGKRLHAVQAAGEAVRTALRQCARELEVGSEPAAMAAMKVALAAADRLSSDLAAFEHGVGADAAPLAIAATAAMPSPAN